MELKLELQLKRAATRARVIQSPVEVDTAARQMDEALQKYYYDFSCSRARGKQCERGRGEGRVAEGEGRAKGELRSA